MTDMLDLRDFESWKELNKGKIFSFYDYIFHKISDGKVSTDIFFAFAEVFWPTVIEFGGHFFLKEQFSESKFKDLLENGHNIEYWMNLLTVDSYFDQDEDRNERAQFLVNILSESWKAKLERDFPDARFAVKPFIDQELGDYGLTFCQSAE